MKKVREKNNTNKTDLGNYIHFKRCYVINNILLFKLRKLQKKIVRILFSHSFLVDFIETSHIYEL